MVNSSWRHRWCKKWEIFEEILDDGAAELADPFMENLVLQVPGAPNAELKMHDVVFEDMLLEDTDEEDLFDLFWVIVSSFWVLKIAYALVGV